MLLVLVLIAASVPPVVHVDAASTWARTYRGSEDSNGQGTVLMPDGDIVVTGTLGPHLLVTRLSPEGDIRWSNTYDTGAAALGQDIIGAIACTPSGMLVFGRSGLLRLNDSGTVRWARRYAVDESAELKRASEFTGAAELPDSGYAVCGNTTSGVFVCRLDRNGSVLWAKSYAMARYDRARVFAVPGGGFLLGSTSLGVSTIKLLWLSADGMVQRSLAYEDENGLSSTSGGFMNMTMTSTGPILLQLHYSRVVVDNEPYGCTGTNVIKLNVVGAVQWTTWVGGNDKGMRTAYLHAIDEVPDGSLLLTGDTDFFYERDVTDWGPHGLALELTPQGDLAWVSTVHKNIIVASPHGGAADREHLFGDIAATGDGGVVWAASSSLEADHRNMLVIRMGPDGTAGKLGSYLNRVDIADTHIVRIEHPLVSVTTAARTSSAITCESEDIEVPSTGAGLTGTDVEGTVLATLTLRPLYPADAGTASTIMQGGTMYRYYTMLDAEGKTVQGAELSYHGPFSTRTLTATSDEDGKIVFSFAVPRTATAKHWDSTLTIDRVRVNGLRSVLSSKPDFAADVQALSWSTNWMMGYGLGGKAGIEVAVAAQQGGGMVVTRTQADPAKEGAGSLMVADSMASEVAIGMSAELTGGHLGPVEAKVGDASAKASVGTFIDFATLFRQPSECSATDKLMAALTLLCGVGQTMTAGATTVISLAQQAIVAALSSGVDMDHVTGGVSLGISADASALAMQLIKEEEKQPDEKKAKKSSLSGLSIGKLGGSAKVTISISGYPATGEASGKAGLESEISFSLLEALGYSVAGWSDAQGISAEVYVDVSKKSFDRCILTVTTTPDEQGESQETRLTLTTSLLGPAVTAIEALAVLAPSDAESSDGRVVLTEGLCGEIMQAVENAVTSIAVPYEHVVTQDKNPTSIEVGLGVNILGAQVDLAIKPKWGRYQSYPLERGVFVPIDKELRIGRMVKLESYPADLFSSPVDTLGDVIVELLKGVGDLLSKMWDIATGVLKSAADTILSTGAGIGSAVEGGATTVFQKGTSIILSPFTYAPDPQMTFVAVTSTRKVTLIGTPSASDAFAVGGTYALQPENGTLSKPASLTLNYTSDAVRGRDPETFGVYHYDPVQRSWTPVRSTHDRDARKLSAQITQLGGYCIGSDATPPTFELLLPSGMPPVVTTSLPRLTVACRDQGSGIVPSTFTASIDGKPVQADWSAAALQGMLTVVDPLVDGSHKVVVQAADGSGNQGSATFDVEVRQAPAPPVLRVDSVSTGKVQLGLQAGTGGGTATSFVLWRSEPSVGAVYHRKATVKAGAGAYIDTDVKSGVTYLYAATGVTSADTEGPMSEPLSVTLPSSPGSGDQTGTGGSHGSSLLWLLAISFVVLLALVFIIDALVKRRRRRPPAA
jgi:hypothetical protein